MSYITPAIVTAQTKGGEGVVAFTYIPECVAAEQAPVVSLERVERDRPMVAVSEYERKRLSLEGFRVVTSSEMGNWLRRNLKTNFK